MKTNHQINATKNLYNKSPIVLICLLLVSTSFSGCLSTHFVHEAVGRKARINFEVLNPQMPNPMIHWAEYPNPGDAALTLNPQLPNCQKLRFFVNPTGSDAHELSDKFSEVEPIKLRTKKDEQNLWEFVPPDQCAVLLAVGYGDFVGLSASTRSGVFQRQEFSFQEGIEGHLFYLLVAADGLIFSEPLVTPIFTLAALAIPSVDNVTVVFDFPDGRTEETKLTYDEASGILKNHFSNSDFDELNFSPSNFVNFWLHAAVIKLRLDFKTQGLRPNPDYPGFKAYIRSIDRFKGFWHYRVDGSAIESDLTQGANLKSGSVIRFSLS